MNRKLTKLLLVTAVCINLLLGMVIPVGAQDVTPTPPVVVLSSDPGVVSFTQLDQGEITLVGPYDGDGFTFSIPANWGLTGGIQLNLSLGVSLRSAVGAQAGTYVSGGGSTLTVLLNDEVVSIAYLGAVGETNVTIQIPGEVLADRLDEPLALSFYLDASQSCYADDQTIVFIHDDSYFNIPHELVQPDTSLVNFPRPIVQNSIDPDSVLIVVPNQPTSDELQAAMTVAAGLGNLSDNKIKLEMLTLGSFKPEQETAQLASANHVIFIGKPASLPDMSLLNLPLPVRSNQFELSGSPDDGVVEMINSPWSQAHVVLVVSGNSDAGVVRAAQAVSTGVIRPGNTRNLAIVQDVQPISVAATQATDLSLSDLDPSYTGSLFKSRGFNSRSFVFNVPASLTASPDSYFELVFGHSAIINYNRSAIGVRLNGKTIGSIRMSDTTAGFPTNRSRILIPGPALKPGDNVLEIIANIEYREDEFCDPPEIDGMWINIWPESFLHLPLETATIDPVSTQDLTSYPVPFIYDPLLGNTAFVLSKDDPATWQKALQISAYLGDEANGTVSLLEVFFDGEITDEQREKYNFLVIGIPSQISLIDELNSVLPAPFSEGSDMADESAFQVVYRIPPDSPMGYVQIVPSPWNVENVVLTILGNTSQGVNWAASSIIDPLLRTRLAGNFAVVNDRQIISTDTRSASVSTGISATPVVGDEETPSGDVPSFAETDVDDNEQNWILPVLEISIALIVLIVILVLAGRWWRSRARRQVNKEES